MLDIRWIRDNPQAARRGAREARHGGSDAAQATVDRPARTATRRAARIWRELQEAQERRNAASKEIGKAMGAKDAALAEKLKAEVAEIKSFIQQGEATRARARQARCTMRWR